MSSESSDDLVARLKSGIGKEVIYRAPDALGRPAIRMYALAIGDFNPAYTDVEFARNQGLQDVMAPPTLICDTWQYIDSDMDDDGDLYGRGEARELRGLRAGNDYEFFQPVHPDDVITAHWKIKDVYEKTGRSGNLVFQEIEVTFYNQREEMLARNTETHFYRP